MLYSLDLSHHPWTRAPDPARAAVDTLALARAADKASIDAPANSRLLVAVLPGTAFFAAPEPSSGITALGGGAGRYGNDRKGDLLFDARP